MNALIIGQIQAEDVTLSVKAFPAGVAREKYIMISLEKEEALINCFLDSENIEKLKGLLNDIHESEPMPDHDPYEDNMTDAEADADTLASAGWGSDEDYGYCGD